MFQTLRVLYFFHSHLQYSVFKLDSIKSVLLILIRFKKIGLLNGREGDRAGASPL
jgi:hypothetical protein